LSDSDKTDPAITGAVVSPNLELAGIPKFKPVKVIVNPPLVGPVGGMMDVNDGLSYENSCDVDATNRPSSTYTGNSFPVPNGVCVFMDESEVHIVGYPYWDWVPTLTIGVVSTTPKFMPYKVMALPPEVTSLLLPIDETLGGS